MFSSGDKGQPKWHGGTKDAAHCQAWLSAVETALKAGDVQSEDSRAQLLQELELAKQTLEQALSR